MLQSSTFLPMPANVIKVIWSDPDISIVSPMTSDDARLDGGGSHRSRRSARATFGPVWKTPVVRRVGRDVRQARAVGRGRGSSLAKWQNLHVGSSVHAPDALGREGHYIVRGIYDGDNSTFTGFIVAPPGFDAISTNRDPDIVLGQTTSGTDPEAVVKRVGLTLQKSYPIVEIKTSDQFVQSQLDNLNKIVYLLYALLAMSVIISLFGIVNSLVLSIFERTREIGMLRAIGLSRRQTRRMVRYESVITSVIGGILGTIVGLFFGWVMAKGLENEGIQFAVPVGQLIIFLVVAAIVGVLAAILPARRASRVKVLEALAYE